ncbi:(Trans)glycosidase [Glarea lozoyensis ATCC 20868]|uniref:1,3-beta-glucanosyltransferase n=2 Tax=Glarea lozoyensis TaxID=101852 RepID=S3DWP9_GLAL2|nr:(Trans)glycosidase [Glarea lozoyensis ATCC 20868]EPE30783.1 (Trans)glycosidase [Glarea lozoyensis ATCC 20868]
MGKSSLLPLFAAATALMSTASATLDPIVIKGSKFFYKTNGTQFFIKGVAYQSGIGSNGLEPAAGTKYVDPLGDEATCKRDVPRLQALGANTIRTYAIDPTLDHKPCMALLDAAGIYVISDLGEPSLSIDRSNPTWDVSLYQRYTSVIDALSPFTNTIGYFAGNEVPNNLTYTSSAAYVKAAVRDSKAYIKSKGYTQGVGYAADDDQTVRAQVASYFNCGDSSSTIDFWGYNIYEWCGDSSFQESGYADRVKEFSTYSVPSFFAEYGCNKPGGAAARKFSEVASLYGTDMTPVFSGGIVYEYFQEQNDFGLVSVVNSASVSPLSDYAAFSTALNAVKPSATQSASYTPTNSALSCPTVGANWAAASVLPPTPNTNVCACMVSSLSCTTKSSIDDLAVGQLFSTVCGLPGNPCKNVIGNATTGVYGAYSMCNATERLANAFDTYYQGLSATNKATGCDFGGNATLVSKPAVGASCSSAIASATAAAGAAASGGSSGSSSGGASSSASTSKSDAPNSIVGASLGLTKYFTVGFAMIAGFSGMGMILL